MGWAGITANVAAVLPAERWPIGSAFQTFDSLEKIAHNAKAVRPLREMRGVSRVEVA